jgi:hypothetical protein
VSNVAVFMTANAAASAAAAEQRALDAFRLADATAADRALLLERIGLARDSTVERLLAAGVLRDAGRGRLYLDEAAVIARRRATTASPRKVILLTVLVAVLVWGVLVALLMRSRP